MRWPEVRRLYQWLVKLGAKVWFDELSLLPGQDWSTEIHAAVRNSDLVLVCLSTRAVKKVGFIQKEIQLALDVADEQPDDSIYVVPVKLEECDVPTRLSRWQWVSLFDASGHDRLAQTLNARAQALRTGGPRRG
jgi:hypothetical protein